MNTYVIDILCDDNHVYRIIADSDCEEQARREVIGEAIAKNLWVKRVFMKQAMPKEDYDKLIQHKNDLLDNAKFEEDVQSYRDDGVVPPRECPDDDGELC
ncbi:MAG: hypothetical protein ACYSYU_00315 [Planctomycetota bacterium]|jgi:hypothetical protein